MPKLLEISIVCLMVGAGIIAVSVILMGLKINTLRETIDLFAIGMAFGAIGSVLRNIHYWIKKRMR